MSEREIEVIGRLFEAFNSGGVEATVELLHPDVVFNEPPEQPGASSFRGRAAVVEGFGLWAATWEAHRSEVERMVDAGDGRVVVLTRDRLVGRDGIEVEQRGGVVFWLEGGQVVRFDSFWDRDKALGAVGMSENSELVRRWFRGLERAELGLELCDPAIEIHNWDEFPITGPYRGHAGVRRWWDDIGDAFENLDWELLDLIDVGDERVVTVQRFKGRFRLTGIETDFAWGSVISIRSGRIASAIGYASPRRARKAAGLEPPDPAPGDRPSLP